MVAFRVATIFSSIGAVLTVVDHTLTIDINEEKFTSVTTRKAGRKRNNLSKRYEEIMEYRETHSRRNLPMAGADQADVLPAVEGNEGTILNLRLS